MWKKEMAKLRKKEKEASGKALSEKLQQVEDLNLPGEEYEKICSFESYNEAQGALWDMGGWVTSKSGRRGSTKTNATCRQNAPYVWRHTNAFKCNSCRMQHGGNAQ